MSRPSENTSFLSACANIEFKLEHGERPTDEEWAALSEEMAIMKCELHLQEQKLRDSIPPSPRRGPDLFKI